MQPKADRIEIVKQRVIKRARTTLRYRIQIAPTRTEVVCGLSEIAKVRNRTHNGGSVRRSCAHTTHRRTQEHASVSARLRTDTRFAGRAPRR